MLAVPVELYRHVVPLALGVEVAGLHRPADAQVLEQGDEVDPLLPADLGGAVPGAVVDDHVVQGKAAALPVLPHPLDYFLMLASSL